MPPLQGAPEARSTRCCSPLPLQALVGQRQEAVDLHSNFTAVWQSYGWLPEAYSIDTSRINPDDPGYNLRPEHVESTYLLHATTGDPRYLKTARSLLQVGAGLWAGRRGPGGRAAASGVAAGGARRRPVQEEEGASAEARAVRCRCWSTTASSAATPRPAT